MRNDSHIDWLSQSCNHFNNQIITHLPSDNSQLSQAMRYAATNGGKRVRPLLTYAASQATTPSTQLDRVATAVELIHCYSLVHDDLPAMDDDDLRRGQPSCHKAYDEATAILVGDALQSLAFELLTQAPLPNQVALIHTLATASGAQGMAGGQSLDMQASAHHASLEQLQTIHHLKTGCLISAAITMGALVSEQPDDQQTLMNNIGQHLGLAFQIRDDIRDVECDQAELGKTAGKDQAQAKMTYPALMGIDAAKTELAAHLSTALALSHQLTSPKGFIAILSLLEK